MTQRTHLAILFALLALGSAACAGSAEELILGPAAEIDAITFEGNTRFSHDELLQHMHLGESSWVPFSPDHRLNEALVAVDAARLEELYHAWGYYDATITSIRVEPVEDEVRLHFVVDEGEPTRVRQVRFTWEDADAVEDEARREIEALTTLREGEPMETPRLNDAIGAMRQALQTRGHPLARVTGQADVYEGARQADVSLRLEPGPRATVREVRLTGLDEVPEEPVQREVRFAIDQLCTPALLRQVEESVRAMRVFRWVAVRTDEVIDDQGQIALLVRVSEAAPQSVKLGATASFEAIRWQEELVAGYTHTNPFGELTRLDVALSAGWAELPDPFDPLAHGPVGVLSPQLTRKGLLEDQLLWSLQPAFSLDVLEGYQYGSASNRIGVSRWFGSVVRTDLSHNLRYVDFFNVSAQIDTNASILGRDFRDPFVLSFLEAQVGFYWTDSILEPTEGLILDLTGALAGGPFLGDYSFGKASAGARVYWPVAGPVSVALRLQSGMIVPFGDEGGAPLNHRFYLGGANSVRGWGSRRLSPQLKECAEGETECTGIPIGGFTMVQGNLELRLKLFGALSLIGFLDAGDVQADALTWRVEAWNYSAGPGLRVDTPVGLFRLDAGFRLNDTGAFPDEPGWALYFGIGEAF